MQFEIRLIGNAGRDRTVTAEYFRTDDSDRFVEFKDAEHKVVYAVQAAEVADITRL